MRVLQLGKFYFPEVGGIETALKDICESLADQVDFRVLVANTRWQTEHEPGRIAVTRAASAGKMFSCSMAPTYPFWARRFEADLIHVHLANPLAEISALLANRDVPVVAHFHSDVVRPVPGPLRAVYNRFLHAFYRRVNCIVVPTPRHIEVSNFVPHYREKCRVVPFGIPVSRFDLDETGERRVDGLRDEMPTVLFVGRLVHYKGVEFLIRAMENVNARLWIVGTGPLEASLKQLAVSLGVADRVVFLGHLSDADLVAYYHACDVFALPSITNQEMFGLVQLEAMACRKPVISTDLPTGVPWVNQHGKTGYCVDPGNARELACALSRVLESRELCQEMGAAGRERVEQQFSSAKMGEAMLRVYEEVLSQAYEPAAVQQLEPAVNSFSD
ncbi:MAG TPA: glycosyltransferase [Candidatus Bathyarchaeia archaeon]|nr:glycosyltransferase [Candidatus Bathyarchaeia archaeon]